MNFNMNETHHILIWSNFTEASGSESPAQSGVLPYMRAVGH